MRKARLDGIADAYNVVGALITISILSPRLELALNANGERSLYLLLGIGAVFSCYLFLYAALPRVAIMGNGQLGSRPVLVLKLAGPLIALGGIYIAA